VSHPATKLSSFGGSSIEVLRAAPATLADLAGASLDGAGPGAGEQMQERLFVLEALFFSPSGEGAEVTQEFAF